jgi:PST family polysaccharide transporter
LRHRNIVENAAALGAVQLISLLLPLIALPYLAGRLGADALGRMAFALSIAQIAVTLTDYGFNLSAARVVALHRDEPQRLADIWCTVTVIRAGFALLGMAAVALAALVSNRIRADIGLIALAYVMVLGNVVFAQWFFQGLQQLRLVSAIQVLARFAVFGAIFALVKSPGDLVWATFLQGAGVLLGGLLALPFVLRALKDARLRWPGHREIGLQLREGWHVFLSTAAVSLYTGANAFFLGMVASPSAVGYYHVAEKLIRAVQTLYGPISGAIYPHVSRLAREDTEGLLRFNRHIAAFIGTGAALASLGVLALAPFVVESVFGVHFAPAASILRVFAPLPLLTVLSNILGVQTMLPLGMEALFSRVLIAAAVVDVALFMPAAFLAGGIGAAGANVAVELFVTAAMAILLHRRRRNPLTFHFHQARTELK